LFHLVFGSHIGADSGEKSGLASDIDTMGEKSLNALDTERPIREGRLEFTGTMSPLGLTTDIRGR
jgi:hypothetical protein